MNTRVQVEHCVTEMTTGIDIVKTGIRVAAGEPLPFTQDDVHAARPRDRVPHQLPRTRPRGSCPHPGRIASYREPSGPGVRVDSGVGAGSEISPIYDPMIAKLIVWDSDRAAATRRMLRALGEFEITGLTHADPVPPAAARDRAVGSEARPAATCSRTTSGSRRSGPPPARRTPTAPAKQRRRRSRSTTPSRSADGASTCA